MRLRRLCPRMRLRLCLRLRLRLRLRPGRLCLHLPQPRVLGLQLRLRPRLRLHTRARRRIGDLRFDPILRGPTRTRLCLSLHAGESFCSDTTLCFCAGRMEMGEKKKGMERRRR